MPDDLPKILVREMPVPEKRKAATPKQVAEVLIRQDGACSGCKARLGYGVPYHIDHVQPLDLLGAHSVDNFQALCEPCHKVKTKSDVAKIAKGRRLRGEVGTGPKKRIVSRGFPKHLRKRMDGSVVPR